jgi:hypothetical protein
MTIGVVSDVGDAVAAGLVEDVPGVGESGFAFPGGLWVQLVKAMAITTNIGSTTHG